MSYAILGFVEGIEPIAIMGKYGRGAFYRTLDYIPSSTISGAIISALRSKERQPQSLSELRKELMRNTLWISHAYPIGNEKRLSVFNPPPLPLTTLAMKDGKYVSISLMAAKLSKTGNLDIVEALYQLDSKVGRVFAYVLNGCIKKAEPYPKKVCTRVCLDLKRRTAFIGEEGRGLLYTIEYIDAGVKPPRFVFKGIVDEEVLDFIREGLELRIGSRRTQGFGLIRLSIKEEVDITEYLEKRRATIEETLVDGYLTVDVVTYLRSDDYLKNLGRLLYQRVRREHVKNWLLDRFIIYSNAVHPGGVYVLEPSVDSDKLAHLEVKPPDDPVARLHGMDMLFFNNPVHFVKI